jgi:hypothetical protein
MTSLFKSTTTYDPIKALLNAPTEEERDELTEKWRNSKLEELNFVGIVVSHCCAKLRFYCERVSRTSSDPPFKPILEVCFDMSI